MQMKNSTLLSVNSKTTEKGYKSRLTMNGDMEKMVAVGVVWGATNALIRRGALLWDKRSSKTESPPHIPSNLRRKILVSLRDWINLFLFWQYSVPFLINLSASATFFSLLSNAPISLAVPVTNATTFAATAVFGILLGEEIKIRLALLGTTFIVFGIWLCVNS